MKHILLLTNELATVSAVSAALESNGKLDSGDVCRNVSDLAARLEQSGAPAALIDIDAQPQRTLAAIEPLARRFSETRFVVLSGTLQSDLLIEAMQVGARHFMVKEAIPADLMGVLRRICAAQGNARQGAAVTVLSAGGGCGATTVAVNLAAELSLLGLGTAGPSLVIDMDHVYGAAATYLGVDGEYGLLDLLDRPGPLDAELIQSTALKHSEQMHALISTARGRLGGAVTLDPKRVGALVHACKNTYAWTVVDASRVPFAVVAELVAQSNTTILLLQLTIKDIRVARQTLAGLSQLGVSAGAVRLMVTRYHRRKMLISLEEARNALGLLPGTCMECLSNDYQAVTSAVNLGKPLAIAASRSDVRRELQKVAAGLNASNAVAAR
ncbi:MAG: response regulator receiver protein [Phycisphaerales bacterium]|nr:response regulator receiver protein [Phycisphaerales bacterium]